MHQTPQMPVSSSLLAIAVLVQCYATRSHSGCQPLELFASTIECRTQAANYQKFDRRAIARTGLPAIVSYKCIEPK